MLPSSFLRTGEGGGGGEDTTTSLEDGRILVLEGEKRIAENGGGGMTGGCVSGMEFDEARKQNNEKNPILSPLVNPSPPQHPPHL